MDSEPSDEISAEPRRISRRGLWLITVAGLLVALAVAVLAAVRYHGQVTALRQQVRSAVSARPVSVPLPGVSSAVYPLPADGPLSGEVTVFLIRVAGGPARVVVSARFTGGRAHTRYDLVAADCTAGSGDRSWASGTSDGHGAVALTGPGWPAAAGHYYAFELSPSPSRSGPGLHGYLASAGGLSAFHNGYAPCAP